MRIPCTGCFLLGCCAISVVVFAHEPSDHFPSPPFGENIPGDYALLYEQDFSDSDALSDFELRDPSIWRLGRDRGEHFLDLFQGTGTYKPRTNPPRSIALLTGFKVGDFILEVDVESTDMFDGAHGDVCFFLGASDPSTFHYVHIAGAADPKDNKVFLLNDAPGTDAVLHVENGVAWGMGVRHRVRVERLLNGGRIRVYVDDMDEPVMEMADLHFDHGHIGFGSFDNICRFFHIRLYAQGTEPDEINALD